MTKPTPKPSINWEQVKALCARYLDDLEEYRTDDGLDFDARIAEAVLKAVYGREVFEWMNEVTG